MSDKCGSNHAGDRTICHAEPGDSCTVDDCELCEAIIGGVGKCASICSFGSDCTGATDGSWSRGPGLPYDSRDVLCVTSTINPDLGVCRVNLAFGCYVFSEDSCRAGYHCSSTRWDNWDSYCQANRRRVGEPCFEDSSCRSGICGPDRLCREGGLAEECSDDDDCAGPLLCGPSNQCIEGTIGDACGNDDDCMSGICTPLGECGTGEAGEPCERQGQCSEGLVCNEGGACDTLCTGVSVKCWDLAGTECGSVPQCLRGRCEPNYGACPRTKVSSRCTPASTCLIREPGAWCTSRYCEKPYGDCNATSVCTWNDDTCRGEVPECPELDVAGCADQPGCELTPLID